METSTAGPYAGFVDDASPVGASPLQRSPFVGARAVTDTALPDVPADAGPLRVVLTGGAGQVPGPVALCARRGLDLRSLEVALRDLDDPATNARRVVAAVDAVRSDTGLLTTDGEDVVVHVAVAGPPGAGWLVAADEVAAAELALALPTDAPWLEAWVDAALDRELTFVLTGGSTSQAVDALGTTARLWDAAPLPEETVARDEALSRARRWCRSWSTTAPAAALAHLAGLRG